MEHIIPECLKCGGNMLYTNVRKKRFRCPRCEPDYRSKREVKQMAKLTYIKPDEIPEVARIRPSQGKALVEEFLESGRPSAKITLEKDDKARSIGWSARRYLKGNKEADKKVSVRVIGGSIFFEKKKGQGK